MRTSNKSEAFKLARQLDGDGRGDDLPSQFENDANLTRFWDEFRCDALPEPLDAIWLQCVIAMPTASAVRLLQSAAHHAPINGVLDDDTLASVLKVRSAGVEEWLLDCQAGYYIGAAQRDLCGFDLGAGLRRIDRCNQFLVEWIEGHRFAPLHSV